VKSLIFKKKNLIAVAMAAVVAVAGFGAYRAQAAGKIDETKQCSITVKFENPNNATGATDANKITSYNGDVEVDFYQLAEVESNGDIGIALADVDLSALSKSDVTAEEIKTVADKAYDVVKASNPNYTVTINPSKDSTKSVNVNRGIYLYVVKDFQNNQYEYTFEKYIVMAPYSTTISQGTKVDENGNIVNITPSDEWIYNPEIALKYSVEEIYGSLEITKELKTYNKSLGTTPFVFEVEASYGKDESKEIVYSNVFTMNFSEPGTQTVTVPNIPANSTVVVTEVYSGASYKLVANDEDVTTINETHEVTIQKDVTAKTKFTNDYDNQTDVGAISIENHFNENGYVDSNINPNSTTTENVETEN